MAALVDARLVGLQDEPQLEAGVAQRRAQGVHDLLRLGAVVRRSSTNAVTSAQRVVACRTEPPVDHVLHAPVQRA